MTAFVGAVAIPTLTTPHAPAGGSPVVPVSRSRDERWLNGNPRSAMDTAGGGIVDRPRPTVKPAIDDWLLQRCWGAAPPHGGTVDGDARNALIPGGDAVRIIRPVNEPPATPHPSEPLAPQPSNGATTPRRDRPDRARATKFVRR